MSDFGFGTYALDDEGAGGHPHPMEIARELIATGKPRSALEVLSLHHDQLVDDPAYLLICSEAWWATGDALRAQQALLGAARLAPEDPRPLRLLGDLLAERGEQERAERLLEKARALELGAAEDEGPPQEDTEDDLIAVAERHDRTNQASLTPMQIMMAAAVLIAVIALILAIRFVAAPREGAPTAQGSGPARVAAIEETQGKTSTELGPSGPAESQPLQAEPVPPASPEPASVQAALIAQVSENAGTQVPAPERGRDETPAKPKSARPSAKSRPKPKAKAKPPTWEAPSSEATVTPAGDAPIAAPNDAVVNAELASMGPGGLTTRADELYAQGHTGLAASYYRRALEIDPDFAPALVGIGRGILRAEKYTEAMENATRALQLARGVDARPGLEAEAIYQMGRVHLERGERDAARRLLRQSISLSGTPPEAWFYLGEALASDNSPAARTAYEKYLELVPRGHLAARARRAIQ